MVFDMKIANVAFIWPATSFSGACAVMKRGLLFIINGYVREIWRKAAILLR